MEGGGNHGTDTGKVSVRPLVAAPDDGPGTNRSDTYRFGSGREGRRGKRGGR